MMGNKIFTILTLKEFAYIDLCIKKYVSIIRKYHKHTTQTNSRHREEESQNIYSK